MNDKKKMMDYETALERRLERFCERNGWIASAHVSFDADYVDCQLEKFGREEVRDEVDALNSLEAFLSQEFGFRLADNPTALRRDIEKIPNTIAPIKREAEKASESICSAESMGGHRGAARLES